MRRKVERGWGVLARSVLAGAVSGAAASWIMEKAQGRISSLGSERTKEREQAAQGGLEPATYRAAEAAAAKLGVEIPEARKPLAGEVVHYATGAAWGALLGAAAHLLGTRGVLSGLAFGAVVWFVGDELLVPGLGFSRPATSYPASAHAKALAAHLVYGAATGTGLRLLH